MTPELLIQHPDGTSRIYPLDRVRVTLGRSFDNDLAYPEDPVLSRRHMALEQSGTEWWIQDLGSKNGTLVNGARLAARQRLRSGDRIAVGRVLLTFRQNDPGMDQTVMFISEDATEQTSLSTRLVNVVGTERNSLAAALRSPALQGTPRMQALLDAGRELAGEQPLPELFRNILDLAVTSVGARRGVVLIQEGEELVPRAARGDSFRISQAVRDRVLTGRESLLIVDASQDEALRASMTIVAQNIRSLIAVPLQTGERVIGLIYVDSPEIIRPFTSEDLTLLTVMANIAAIRIEHARLREVEQAERAMAKELEQAAEIQQGLLPKVAPSIPGYELAGMSVACRSVGGDYFDFLKYPGHKLGVIVGDVAGKGLPAALLMSSLQARVQVLSEDGSDLATLMTRLNRSVGGSCPSNRFITFFMCVLDPATGEFEYSNAGHNPPYLFRADGSHEMLEVGGPVLGILRTFPYQSAKGRLNPGDSLTLFSDGVTEAHGYSEDEYGEERLVQELARCHQRPARDMLLTVHAAVERFMAGAPAPDDVTLVVLKRL